MHGSQAFMMMVTLRERSIAEEALQSERATTQQDYDEMEAEKMRLDIECRYVQQY